MTFDQLLTDVLAMAAARGVTAEVGANHVIVREADEWIADLRFDLNPAGGFYVSPLDDNGVMLGKATAFDTVQDAAEHFDIG